MAAVKRQRLGHDADQTNGPFSSRTRLGDKCYHSEQDVVPSQVDSHVLRGKKVRPTRCNAIVPWHRRDGLDDVADYRGIP